MKTIYKISGIAVIVLFAAACGSSTKQDKGTLGEKKAKLEKLKDQQSALNQQISSLEAEIAKEDTSAASPQNVKLVSVTPVSTERFTHYIDLQGKVDAENIAYVSPRGAGGLVTAIYVKQGDYVKKGQLLMKLDDAVIQQQIKQVEVQLDLAKSLYERRKNLWDQNIGTEVELLQAKTNVENLEKQIAMLQEQVSMSNVYAGISGVADQVNIKVGEFFSPQSAAVSGIRIVNTNDLKIVAQVPENYLDRVKEGTPVKITLPDINKTVTSRVNVKGKTIDPSSRSFYIEAKVPASKDFHPNQVAVVQIQDYTKGNAITIPVNTIQNDDKGKYVMVVEKESGKTVAKKKSVEIGEVYGSELEIRSGLAKGDAVITEGFQGLYDGQPVTTLAN